MISKKMESALNKQLVFEVSSAYYYAAAAAYFQHGSLDGFAHWMKVQGQEELDHARRFFDYIDAVGARVELDALDKPPKEFESPLAAFEHILAHEQAVTKEIHKLVDLAHEENDHATLAFLQWFVTEQVEEEKIANDIILKLKMVGVDPRGIYLMDREMAQRPAHGGASA